MKILRFPSASNGKVFTEFLSGIHLLCFIPPVFLRRNAGYSFKILPEKRLIREIQFLADLLDRHVGAKQRFGFQNHVIVYPFERRFAGRFFDNGG
jgi:hypothetical protein